MAQHMPEESGPLLLSTRAALRLSLLLQHGVENTPSMAAVLARAGLPPAAAAVAAALLDQPVPLGSVYEDSSPPWLAARDVLAEVAVSTSLLRALQVRECFSTYAFFFLAAHRAPSSIMNKEEHKKRLLCLQVPAGSLVAVRNAGRPEVLPHLARVVPAPDSSSRHALPTAYLAPSLAHNLGLPLHLDALLRQPGPGGTSNPHDAPRPGRVLLQRYAAPAGVAVAMLPQPMSDGAAVPLAAEVHVAVVRRPSTVLLQSPHSTATSNNAGSPADGNRGNAGSHAGDSAQLGGMCAAGSSEEAGADVVAALQSWFMGHTRVVCKGDVLAVPKQVGLGSLAAHLVPNLHSGSQPGRHEQELVYFKIAKLVLGSSQEGHTATSCAGTQPSAVAGPAAVDVSVTAVQLVGTCASSIPVGLDSYLAAAHSSRIPPKEEQQAEEGGQPVWHQLAQLLAAAMHPAGSRLPLRLAVLLHGPSGSGKRTAAAAAAAAAGYHAVSLSCHDIKAPPAAAQWHTLEGLNAAFAAAAEYRPAVLLLHNLQVLVEDAHGASDVIIARTGAALAECIRQGCKRLPAVSSHQGINGDGDNKGRTEAGARSATQELFPAPVVLIACTEAVDDIPAPLRRCFTHEFAVDGPPQRQRQHLLSANLSGAPLASPEATGLPGGLPWLEETAFHTAGLLPRELRTVAAEAAVAAVAAVLPTRDILQEALLQAAPAAEGIGGEGGGGNQRQQAVQVPAAPRLTQQHLAAAVDAVRARTATDIGAPKISDVRWEDVGGLEEVKRSILDTVELPLKHPQLFAGGLRRRSGVLFYGPPGTGKTLLAKAVATECSINFLSVKGPELINMYVGESERQIREVRAPARWVV